MRKRGFLLVTACILIASMLAGCGAGSSQTEIQAQPDIESDGDTAGGKTLVAYFSWSSSGNTEKMATYIQEQTGADLLEIEPVNPYPTDYGECGDVALVERDENARPL